MASVKTRLLQTNVYRKVVVFLNFIDLCVYIEQKEGLTDDIIICMILNCLTMKRLLEFICFYQWKQVREKICINMMGSISTKGEIVIIENKTLNEIVTEVCCIHFRHK